MSSQIFHKGVVSRSLSTHQTGTTWDQEIEILRDACTIGEAALTAANVDRRTIATGPDWFMWKYQTFLGEVDNAWTEYAWRNLAAVSSTNGMVYQQSDPTVNPKILVSGVWPIKYNASHMVANDIDYYWVNSFNLRNVEDTLDASSLLPNASECTYNVIDIQDIESGQYDGFFDAVRLNSHDIFTPSNNLLDKAMDSVRVGGTFIAYDIADFGALYVDAYKVHEQRLHRFSRRLVNRTDYEVHHITHDEMGIALAYRMG